MQWLAKLPHQQRCSVWSLNVLPVSVGVSLNTPVSSYSPKTLMFYSKMPIGVSGTRTS